MPQLHWAGAGGADKQHWAPLASHLWQKKSPGHRGRGRVGDGGQGAGRYWAGTAFRPVPEEKETEVVFHSQTESEYKLNGMQPFMPGSVCIIPQVFFSFCSSKQLFPLPVQCCGKSKILVRSTDHPWLTVGWSISVLGGPSINNLVRPWNQL